MTEETNPEMEVEQNENLVSTQAEEIENDQSTSEEEQAETEDNEENSESEESEQEEELEEAEFEGKKYNLPKELKSALLRQSDYTKKTQEIAELRKKVESDQSDFRKNQDLKDQEFKAFVEISSLQDKMKGYDEAFSSPDWSEVIENDPARAIRADHEYRTLQNQFNQKNQEVNQRQNESYQKQQQAIAKQEDDTRLELQRSIKGWGNGEVEGSLMEYAKSQGAIEEGIKNAFKYDPVAVKLLRKAHLYDQLKKQVAKKPQSPDLKPIKSIKSGNGRVSSNNTPSDKDSSDVWLLKRNAQLKKQS